MAPKFDWDSLVAAFEDIGAAAIGNKTRIDLVVYGGSALMLASNFRFSTEDVDIAAIDRPWPAWFSDVVAAIAARNQWSDDWLNDAVTFHLSPLANRGSDHVEFGSFPKGGSIGLAVSVPSADYLLALKLKAMRVLDPVKGPQEAEDIRNLMQVLRVDSENALAIMSRYFPKLGEDSAKQRFLLKHIGSSPRKDHVDAPVYPR